MTELGHVMIAATAAFLAAGINSVAGGGTLISFPTLMWLGLPSITANATSTMALWPGSMGSMWGFRSELGQTAFRLKWFSLSSLIGGGLGAILLRLTPAALFESLVPFLILFATILFLLERPIQRKLSERGSSDHDNSVGMLGGLALTFLVAIYGGYFGAGMSIMMLAVLGILGLSDILQRTALTSLFALCVNGVAAVLFISLQMVDWHYVLPMTIAAAIGGYSAAGLAKRVGRVVVRRFVIIVGFAVSLVLLARVF